MTGNLFKRDKHVKQSLDKSDEALTTQRDSSSLTDHQKKQQAFLSNLDGATDDEIRSQLRQLGFRDISIPTDIDQQRFQKAEYRAISHDAMSAWLFVPLYHGEDFDFIDYQHLFVGGTSYTMDGNNENPIYRGAYCVRDTGTTWKVERLNDHIVDLEFERIEDAVKCVVEYYRDQGLIK